MAVGISSAHYVESRWRGRHSSVDSLNFSAIQYQTHDNRALHNRLIHSQLLLFSLLATAVMRPWLDILEVLRNQVIALPRGIITPYILEPAILHRARPNKAKLKKHKLKPVTHDDAKTCGVSSL